MCDNCFLLLCRSVVSILACPIECRSVDCNLSDYLNDANMFVTLYSQQPFICFRHKLLRHTSLYVHSFGFNFFSTFNLLLHSN